MWDPSHFDYTPMGFRECVDFRELYQEGYLIECVTECPLMFNRMHNVMHDYRVKRNCVSPFVNHHFFWESNYTAKRMVCCGYLIIL